MDRLPSILFKMQPRDPDCAAAAIFKVNFDLTSADYGVQKLRNLITLRQVRIEIILTVEYRHQIDFGVEAEAGAHGLFDRTFVDHRQHARHCGINQRDLCIRLRSEFGRSS